MDFIVCVLLVYVRVVYRLNKEGVSGVKIIVDIVLVYLINLFVEEIRKKLI